MGCPSWEMAKIILETFLAHLSWVVVARQTNHAFRDPSQLEESTHELAADLGRWKQLRTHFFHDFLGGCVGRSGPYRSCHAPIDSGNGCQHQKEVDSLPEKVSIFSES